MRGPERFEKLDEEQLHLAVTAGGLTSNAGSLRVEHDAEAEVGAA